MWDFERQEIIWAKYPFDTGGMGYYPNYPPNNYVRWAPDSSMFYVYHRLASTGPENLFVARDGQELNALNRDDDGFTYFILGSLFNNPWSPDGDLLAVRKDDVLQLYDARQYTFQAVCRWPDNKPFAPTWSPDGRFIFYRPGRALYALSQATLEIYKIRPVSGSDEVIRILPQEWRHVEPLTYALNSVPLTLRSDKAP